MIKHSTLTTFINLLLLPLASAFGQTQASITETISDKFLQYCKAVPREEIFVHIDRNEFISGEALWFNLYLIERQENRLSRISKLAYVEILNSENRPVVQKRIKIENGTGPGQILLPDTLSTGKYTFRAYTNLMKNFLPVNCFMKELNIYNALSDKTLNGSSGTENFFKNRDENDRYKVKSGSGVDLVINNDYPSQLVVLIRTDETYRSANNNLCYIFIQTHGVINLNRSVQLTSENTRVEINENLLIPGINHITIFDSNGKPLLEKYIYSPQKKHILTLNSADSVGLRDRISIEIGLGKELISGSDSANLSISVAPYTNDQIVSDLSSYMVFGTEFGLLPDEIKNHEFSDISQETIANFLSGVKSTWIDWNVILGGNIPQLKYNPESEEHFLSGSLTGRNNPDAYSSEYLFLSTPGKNAVFQYAKTDEEANFSFSVPVSEEEREYILQPEKVDGNSTIKIHSSFSEEYLPSSKPAESSDIKIPGYISKWSVNYQVNKIYETSVSGEPVNPLIRLPEPVRFYGKPDIELLLADYLALPVMQEVFFELTPGVFLKNRKSEYKMSVADRITDRVYDKPPLLFIDGVVVNDASAIAGLDPDKVERIDAVKDLYLVGDYMFFGIVNVITKAGDFSSVNLPDYAVRLKYKVLEPVRSFYSPDHSDGTSMLKRIPDFRNTLYWNPSVRTGKDGKSRIEFWSSDVVGDYEINIQGITSKGKPFSVRKIIKIK